MGTVTTLINLPPEIILIIGDFLSEDAILALKLTHRQLNACLPLTLHPKHTTVSRCAYLAITTYLSPPTTSSTEYRCVLCKMVYPVYMFRSSSSPACLSIRSAKDTDPTEVVELPHRLCAWHVGRLARVVRTEPGGRNEWVEHTDKMCMHCGIVQRWETCSCSCESCPLTIVKAYTRYCDNGWQCKRFQFVRKVPAGDQNERGKLWVREAWFNPDDPGVTEFVDVPVRENRQVSSSFDS